MKREELIEFLSWYAGMCEMRFTDAYKGSIVDRYLLSLTPAVNESEKPMTAEEWLDKKSQELKYDDFNHWLDCSVWEKQEKTIVSWMEEYASKPTVEPMTAEAYKQSLCDLIEQSLNRVRLKNYTTEDGDGFPLVDFFSVTDTILSGKEEIKNIVEQMYYDMGNWPLFPQASKPTGAERGVRTFLCNRCGATCRLYDGSSGICGGEFIEITTKERDQII